MKVVIIGGVAGGATAAARIRRLDEKAEIVVFERSGYISYANCGLPYYVGDVITDKDELTLQSPAGFKRRFDIDVKIRHEVTAIDGDDCEPCAEEPEHILQKITNQRIQHERKNKCCHSRTKCIE